MLNAVIPKRPDGILVHSRPDMDDAAVAVLGELLARGYDPVVLCEKPLTPDEHALVPNGARVVVKTSLAGKYAFLTARTVITTHGPFRPHRTPRRQRVLNIWHGEPLIKPVGWLAGERPPSCTWAAVLSDLGRAFRCLEFNLPPERVLVQGAPRNDRLLGAQRPAVRATALDGDPFCLVWLPTYRTTSQSDRLDGEAFSGPVPLTEPELHALDEWLESCDAVLFVKPHPVAPKPPAGQFRRIRVIDGEWLLSRGLTLYTFLKGVDCLITDASSVWVDFLLTGRPIVFAFPDLDAYRASRGINLEPFEEWIPGPLVRDGYGLLAELEDLRAGRDRFADARRMAQLRFHRYRDAGSTPRILDAIGLRPRAHVGSGSPIGVDLPSPDGWRPGAEQPEAGAAPGSAQGALRSGSREL